MERYFAGNEVVLTIPLVDSTGAPVSADAADYKVANAAGDEVIAETPITLGGDPTQVQITIPANANELVDGQPRDLRVVLVVFTAGGATRSTAVEYVIEGDDVLLVPVNSFQSYSEAVLTAMDLAGIQSYSAAMREDRITALINAYINLSGTEFFICGRQIKNLQEFTEQEFAALPERFRRALRLAQIIEANELLDFNSVHRKRQSGIMSETIGESSMMFRPGKLMYGPLSRRTTDILRDFISWELKIGRA